MAAISRTMAALPPPSGLARGIFKRETQDQSQATAGAGRARGHLCRVAQARRGAAGTSGHFVHCHARARLAQPVHQKRHNGRSGLEGGHRGTEYAVGAVIWGVELLSWARDTREYYGLNE